MSLHRPYASKGARLQSERVPSVTTILNLLPKPGLSWAAAKETALFAVLHPDKWQGLAEHDAVDVLRRHHRGIWDGRAAMGTLAHAVNDSYCDGNDVDIEKMIDLTIANDPNAKTWVDLDRTDLIEYCLGYVLGIEKWWVDFAPTKVRSEIVVRYPGLFIGQTDLRCEIDGEDWLWDVKTTAKQDEDSGVYGDSWALQVAMYGMATETVDFELQPDSKLKSGFRPVEVGTGPWSPPQRYGVIHLRGEENYSAFEIVVTRDIQRTAVRLARSYKSLQAIPKIPGLVPARRELVDA